MRLDHVSYAVGNSEFRDTVQRLGQELGCTFQDGGRHPNYGTVNFVAPLADGTYIEVVSPLDHPAVDKKTFGRAVKQRASEGGGWLTWVVCVDDITPFEHRLGRPASNGRRVRPDGFALEWEQIGLTDLLEDPQLPFFVQWHSTAAEHPSAGARPGTRITALEISGDKERIEQWLGSDITTALGSVHVEWVGADEPGLVAVHLETNNGTIRLD
ncbi:MAG: VOC family protein [Actinobacteria bacterium]|nr:VOC family protein [Actinomycetota bacterium]